MTTVSAQHTLSDLSPSGFDLWAFTRIHHCCLTPVSSPPVGQSVCICVRPYDWRRTRCNKSSCRHVHTLTTAVRSLQSEPDINSFMSCPHVNSKTFTPLNRQTSAQIKAVSSAILHSSHPSGREAASCQRWLIVPQPWAYRRARRRRT